MGNNVKDSVDRSAKDRRNPFAGPTAAKLSEKNADVKGYLDKLVEDIFVMIDFARKMGISIPEGLQEQISTLLYGEEQISSSVSSDLLEKPLVQE